MKSLSRIFILLALPVFTCCIGPYTFKDSGETITLSEDDTFVIKLEAKPNPNAVWKFATEPQFVKIDETKTDTLNNKSIEYSFYLKAISAGIDHLQLVYTEDDRVIKDFELTVIVGTVGLIEDE